MKITASTLLIRDATLEYPVTLLKLRQDNPNVSFAAEPDQTIVEGLGYSIVQPVPAPLVPLGDVITEAAPTLVNGVWTQTWVNIPAELDFAKTIQSSVLNSACANAIVSGFVSSALGSSHTYPSLMTDQQNLITRETASLYPGLAADWTTSFWCADAQGNWSWTAHTAAQIQQVGMDWRATIEALQNRNAMLQAQVKAAGSLEDVRNVVWA
jgi:hypothetical protein